MEGGKKSNEIPHQNQGNHTAKDACYKTNNQSCRYDCHSLTRVTTQSPQFSHHGVSDEARMNFPTPLTTIYESGLSQVRNGKNLNLIFTVSLSG
jgi:hypothetical protein